MSEQSQNRILFDRACALLAILTAAAYGYGMRIWLLAGTAAGVSLLTEWTCLYLRRKPFTRQHLDAGLSGIILMMLMPPTVSFSLLIMSCIFAIIIGRQLFGGKENPVIHPVAAGYCFAVLCRRSEMMQFPKAFGSLPFSGPAAEQLCDGVSAVWNRGGGLSGYLTDWLIGLPNQPVGTGSVVLLAAAALVLVCRRSASGWVALPAVSFAMFCSVLFGRFQHPAAQMIGCCLSNQTLFAVIFLHSDPDYAPPQLAGSLYGIILAGSVIVLTRLLRVTDAPVTAAVILSPAAISLRELMQFAEPVSGEKGGGERNAEEHPGSTAALP